MKKQHKILKINTIIREVSTKNDIEIKQINYKVNEIIYTHIDHLLLSLKSVIFLSGRQELRRKKGKIFLGSVWVVCGEYKIWKKNSDYHTIQGGRSVKENKSCVLARQVSWPDRR